MSDRESLMNGVFPIELKGEALELIPSISAIQKLSREFGGIPQVITQLKHYHIDAYVAVLAAGLQWKGEKLKHLPEAVFETGMTALSLPLQLYVICLANGGRMAAEAEEPEAGKD